MSEHSPDQQGWQPLEAVDLEAFVDARLQLHWAAQVIDAVGRTHVETSDDDGHTNMGWVDGMQIMAGRYVQGEPSGFASLSIASPALGFHEPGGDRRADIPLEGKTLDDLHARLEDAIAAHTGHERTPLQRPTNDLPEHAVGVGAAFGPIDTRAARMLQAWFHDANLVMRDLRARTPQATLPRLWPHHFDLGMLVAIEPHGNPAEGRSIGIGLTPGDASDPLPYWYVNPYPAPDSIADVRTPRQGAWNTEGFVGIKLAAAEALDGDQETTARRFLDEAVALCRDLLT